MSFFIQPQSEGFHLGAAVVFDILPSVDAVVEGRPSDRAEPQYQRAAADAARKRRTRAEDSPVEGDTQHDLRGGDHPLGERVEGGNGQDSADEQQQQDGVCRKREQAEQTHSADEEGEQDEQQRLTLGEVALRQGTGSRSRGFLVDVAIQQVVPRRTRSARSDGGNGEEKGEGKGEENSGQEGSERVGFPIAIPLDIPLDISIDNNIGQGEREPPPARHQQVEGAAERVEASEFKIGFKHRF